ncbi:GNAT family N-acetyltransferase [Halosimplex salinum]|uniref:GNAT family N-acetyltransferase n=1 Tax=Halosimplex salinum TaxID=1710538 RepID=UPI000F4870E4|nr:GNAT family N-acetyltransferase [Halosimplex salinum]
MGERTAELRRFEPGDGPAVRRLHRRALSDAGTDPDDVPHTEDLDDVESSYLDGGGEFLVCEVDEQVVAMGGLAVEGEGIPHGAGELLRIAVHTDHQRAGYGSAIVDGLEAAARERGLDRVFLWTAQRQRAAVEFYTARGYEGTDHRTEGEYELLRFEKSLDDGGSATPGRADG